MVTYDTLSAFFALASRKSINFMFSCKISLKVHAIIAVISMYHPINASPCAGSGRPVWGMEHTFDFLFFSKKLDAFKFKQSHNYFKDSPPTYLPYHRTV